MMMSPSPSPSPATMKRKSVDEVNDDFSDFSLSSPATKIRRLDAGLLPPIMEEDEELHTTPPPPPPFHHPPAGAGAGVENEERAIVLFNPANNTLHSPPPTFSVTSHILSGLKSQLDLWSRHSNLLKSSAEEDVDDNTSDEDHVSNQCLAVVPWVQSQLPQTAPLVQQVDASETMMMMEEEEEEEADQNEQVASMDIEQEQDNNNFADNNGIDQMPARESFQQWQQQHCMVPPQLIPHNAAPATPNVWFR